MSYVPAVGDWIHVRAQFGRYEAMGKVVHVQPADEVPDAVLMAQLYAKSIERRRGKTSRLGIPTKPSKYARVVFGNERGFMFCNTLSGQYTVTKIDPPKLKLVK